MEGRGFSDLLRNTSEEIFLKTMMENPIGITAPSMEMLGFKKLSQSFRGDSEELFNSWLTHGELPGCISSVVPHRGRQVSRRISTDLSPSQQNVVPFQKKSNDDNTSAHNLSAIDEHPNYPAQCSLRRRYAAMQSSQIATIPQAPKNMPVHGTNKMKQEFTNAYDFVDTPMAEMSNQMHSFMSPSNSSTSFNAPPVATTDAVASVVSMLKGTLERKKLHSKVEMELMEGSSYGMFSSQEAAHNISSNQGPRNQVTGPPNSFHMVSPMQVTGAGNLASVEKSLELSMEVFPTLANQMQIGTASQEPSQSESSTAAPAHSGHTISNCVSSCRHASNGTSDNELKANEYRERIFENNFNDVRKKSNIVRMGSITSAASVEDRADPTKRRRVERSRKMAESKERNSTPPLPSDMQAVLKRCENLEKEVRSLKLNLSFMNRKDSEQTKQIEELQKQNDELVNEKERLLEEIERIISDSSRM